uniref:Uncharacterized protein n=1 Tax=Cannabis sativa TaxID=3483 RepID=A0A803PCR0_CANSA
EMQEMPSTEQLEVDNDALSKQIYELKDERESLRTLLSMKANPIGNFDYLGDSKGMYLDYCAGQTTKENPKATTSIILIDESDKTPDAPQC